MACGGWGLRVGVLLGMVEGAPEGYSRLTARLKARHAREGAHLTTAASAHCGWLASALSTSAVPILRGQGGWRWQRKFLGPGRGVTDHKWACACVCVFVCVRVWVGVCLCLCAQNKHARRARKHTRLWPDTLMTSSTRPVIQ